MATDEKFRVENRQREEARLREADGVEWKPRYFRAVEPGTGDEDALDFIIATHMSVPCLRAPPPKSTDSRSIQ